MSLFVLCRRKFRPRAFARDDNGQALVELALSLTVLLFIIMGIIAFGRIGYTYLAVQNAAREGARVAMLGKDDQEIIAAVQQAAPTLPAADLQITITPAQSARSRGNPVEVTVVYDLTLFEPLVSSLLQNPFPVTGDVVMRYE
ncbi:MAG TPA: TadE/TadG family type IV pilus assembly protein [Limnochordia bacterium]|nr:TadE/TadG family type IV pilus assembly protein [Limnochordia bacterium]